MILDILSESESRLTPRALIRKSARELQISSARARSLVKELTDQGEIVYTYFFGSTFMELSFSKPVRITDHFVLTPPGMAGTKNKTDIDIIIEPGISFGTGSHPTTRLCLNALDHVFFQSHLIKKKDQKKVLDVGTGSGVLAIAALKAGMGSCLALDTDLNCISETRKNSVHNGIELRINVSDDPVEEIKKTFSLICANLRFPTLKRLSQVFYDISEKDAILVLSGIRSWETSGLISHYLETGFKCLLQEDEKKWTGVILQKT